MASLVLIAHNIRSTYNVGSLLRTADGLGVDTVWLTGYTPYPKIAGDKRLLYIIEKLNKQIAKTSLGAETSVHIRIAEDIETCFTHLRHENHVIAALEQSPRSIVLPDYRPPSKIALLVGREVEGIEHDILERCDVLLEIPMLGSKESFNVAQAAAMALYHLRFTR